MQVGVKFISESLLTIGVALGACAYAAAPSVSVPSTPDASGQVVIKGMDLAAYSNVTVRFMHAQLSPIDMVAQVAGNGTFLVRFAPPVNGAYSVQVFDDQGRPIGRGNFGFFR